GIRIARKYGCRGIAEIADLWPESIVAYGIAGKNNPLVVLLRRLEKWIYKKSDAVVFTMEGGYDYIIEQGWEKEIPRSKVFHINNGVDLALFHRNMEQNPLQDDDLVNPDTFKVIYTGSIRRANGLELLVDCAERLKDQPNIRFLVYGAGDDVERLRAACRERNIDNLVFKGPVDKAYIPYILSKSDLNVLNYNPDSTVIYRFGSSQNKLFEYLASGKPILSTVKIAYSILEKYNCGIEAEEPTADGVARGILKLYRMTPQQRMQIQENCRVAAAEYDFKRLTQKLMDVIEGRRE
ncbi:MAG: glycosyltransferase family 4 protein, partial [Christensenellaceae bacterium]